MNYLLSLALWLSKRHVGLSIVTANIRYILMGRKSRIKARNEFFTISSRDFNIYFPSLARGVWVYRNGITARLMEMEKAYRLDLIEFDDRDIVVDVGANFGDFALAVTNKSVHPKNLHLFEPSEEEFKGLSLTLPVSNVYKLGLGKSKSTQTFFVSPEAGDSSFYEPADGYLRQTKVMIDSMDNLELPADQIRLLKIEAEGGEPEVIVGASKTLNRVQYIALDGGPERGLGRTSTWSTCVHILESKGFRLVAMSETRPQAGLFRNDRA